MQAPAYALVMRYVLLFAFIPLLACQFDVVAKDSDVVPCEASQWSDLIGQPRTAAEQIPDPKRMIPPGTAVTKDYRINRTNVDLDANGAITRIWCG